MMRSLRARYGVIRSALCLPALLLGWDMAEGQGRADGMGWSSEVVRVIGEGDSPLEYFFGQVVALDVAPSGEISVLDRQLVSLRVFSPEGRLL